MLRIRSVAHAPQLFDSHIIALALLHAGIREIAQGQQNRRHRAAEFQVLPSLARHKSHRDKLYSGSRSRSRCPDGPFAACAKNIRAARHSEGGSLGEESAWCPQRDSRFLARKVRASEKTL